MKTQISISWSIEDIRSLGFNCTDEQGSKVLSDVERHHDASIGINWDTIRFHAEENNLIETI